MNIFSQNKKIKDSGDLHNLVINFGIPAYQSKTGLKTCPMAGICAKGCYATMGAYIWSNVASVYEERLALTLKPDFAAIAQLELDRYIKRATKTSKQLIVRIHDSGDFYNLDYINKWLRIINNNPSVKFYAYTKMVPIFKRLQSLGSIPDNFTLIYSFGGLSDNLIDVEKDRHSQVFSSLAELVASGYVDTTENDLNAIGVNNKIGLVYHGYKSKTWTTAKAS